MSGNEHELRNSGGDSSPNRRNSGGDSSPNRKKEFARTPKSSGKITVRKGITNNVR